MKKDYKKRDSETIVETNRWGRSFYADVRTSSRQRESWEVLSLTPIERPLNNSMVGKLAKGKVAVFMNAENLFCAQNKITALAGGDFSSEGPNGSGLGMSIILANWSYSSSTPARLVDNLLKPAEGIKPSVSGIPSPEPLQAAGYPSLYHYV